MTIEDYVTLSYLLPVNTLKILTILLLYLSFLIFVSTKNIYQTLETTVFHRLSKHLEFYQKYPAARSIFNSLLAVEYPDETLSLVFDILLDIRLQHKHHFFQLHIHSRSQWPLSFWSAPRIATSRRV